MSDLFMLDTDTASYVIKGTAPTIDRRLLSLNVGQVCISAVTRAELKFGVRQLGRAPRLTARVEAFLNQVRNLPWDDAAADEFAEVRTALERSGTPIGAMDTMIAAHAKAVRAILVTNNLKHFRRVHGLALENWLTNPPPN